MGRRSKPNATGRGGGARFVKLDHGLIDSDAFESLSPVAFKLLVLIWREHAGPETNGRIAYSTREAMKRGISKSHAARAFTELVDLGFLVCERESGFDQKRLAREWRITAEPTRSGPATRDFSDRNRSKKKSQSRPRGT